MAENKNMEEFLDSRWMEKHGWRQTSSEKQRTHREYRKYNGELMTISYGWPLHSQMYYYPKGTLDRREADAMSVCHERIDTLIDFIKKLTDEPGIF